MFETLLRDRDFDDIVESTYLVSQLIWHRKNAPTKAMLERRAKFEKSTAAQTRLAQQIVEAIEEQERTPLKELDDERSSTYVRLLSKIVQDRAKSDLRMDKESGMKLLKELRAYSVQLVGNRPPE